MATGGDDTQTSKRDLVVVTNQSHSHEGVTMRIRYISWLALGLAAAFLVVATAAFTLPVITALALAVSIGMLLVSLGIAREYRNQIATLVPALAAAVVSAWTIVASQVFAESTVQNLTLASALAISGLAIVGMTVHELSSERVVHSLEVGAGDHEAKLAAAA
jgi:FtsH-binding integral membrane protein